LHSLIRLMFLTHGAARGLDTCSSACLPKARSAAQDLPRRTRRAARNEFAFFHRAAWRRSCLCVESRFLPACRIEANFSRSAGSADGMRLAPPSRTLHDTRRAVTYDGKAGLRGRPGVRGRKHQGNRREVRSKAGARRS